MSHTAFQSLACDSLLNKLVVVKLKGAPLPPPQPCSQAPVSFRFFRREPEKDLLSLHRLRHLVQLELLVERSFILRDYLNGHPWPSPCVQELIDQLRELSENRISVITTMRQRNPLRECDCLWEGD